MYASSRVPLLARKLIKICYRKTCTVCIANNININTFSLVGMQVPEKYKENFDVSSEGPSSGGRPWRTPDEGPSLEW